MKVSVSSAVLRFCSLLQGGCRSLWGSLESQEYLLSCYEPGGLTQESWCADICKEILKPDRSTPSRQWHKLRWVFIGGSLKRCPMDLRARGGGDLGMVCPGFHCSVCSWLSGTWDSLTLLFPVPPSPGLGVVCGQHPCRNSLQIHPSWSHIPALQIKDAFPHLLLLHRKGNDAK